MATSNGNSKLAALKASALREQGEGASQSNNSNAILNDLGESIKSDLLAGKEVRLIDFPSEQRPQVIGVIATLRDELPIRTGWQTVRESHLSETRLRARRYSISGEYLREVGHD